MKTRDSAALHHALYVPLDQDVCRSHKTNMVTARWVLAALTGQMGKFSNEVVIAHDALAEEASLSRTTVQKALAALAEMKVIYIHHQGLKKPNKYVYHETFTHRSPEARWGFRRYRPGVDRLLVLATWYDERLMSHDLAALLGVSVQYVNRRLKELEITISRTRRRKLREPLVDRGEPDVGSEYKDGQPQVSTLYLNNSITHTDRDTHSRVRAAPEGESLREEDMSSSHGKYFPGGLPPFPYVSSSTCKEDDRLRSLFLAEDDDDSSLFNLSRSTDGPEKKPKRTPRSSRLVDTWDAKDITDEFFSVWVHHFGKTPGHTGRRAGFVKRVNSYLTEEDLSPEFMIACMLVFMKKVRNKSITWDRSQYEPWRIFVSRISTLSKEAGGLLSSKKKESPLLNNSGSLGDFVKSDVLKEVPGDV